MGAGVDIVSGESCSGRSRPASIPDKVVYSGVGKTHEEIRQALAADILMFNVESFQELVVIDDDRPGHEEDGQDLRSGSIPTSTPRPTRRYPRASRSISSASTSRRWSPTTKRRGALSNIEVVGVDCHIGSQVTELGPFVDALGKLKELVRDPQGARFYHPDTSISAEGSGSPTGTKSRPIPRRTDGRSTRSPGTSGSPSCWSRAGCWWETRASC